MSLPPAGITLDTPGLAFFFPRLEIWIFSVANLPTETTLLIRMFHLVILLRTELGGESVGPTPLVITDLANAGPRVENLAGPHAHLLGNHELCDLLQVEVLVGGGLSEDFLLDGGIFQPPHQLVAHHLV